MIPAQRRPQHDESRPEDVRPVRIVYSATVTQPGDSQAGNGFRTYRATVNVQPDQTRTGGAK